MRKRGRIYLLFILLMLGIFFTGFHPSVSWGLTPEQIVVVANKMAWNSIELAKYYMKLRNIPSDNLIQIKAPEEEICNREDYDKDIASPIRSFLKKHDPTGGRFHCLVEGYFLTSPFLSWRMVLAGDSVYYAFKNKPQFDAPKKK